MIQAVPGRRAGARYRRLEPIHLFLIALWLAGCGAILPQHHWVAAVAAADGLVAFYLLGPAASITVTPTHVIVDNPYVHHEIPRTAIAGPAADGFWFQRLPLRTGGAVRLVALSLNLPRNYPDQLGRHDHRSLPALLARVPPQDSNAETRSAPRLLSIALATLAVAATLTGCLAATR